MTLVRRLQAGSAAAALVVAVTCSQTWGDAVDRAPASKAAARAAVKPDAVTAVGRFAGKPVVTYESAAGERMFALQLQPTLAAVAPRPRDVVLMIDTSASQAGGPMQRSRALADEVLKTLGADDRVSLWTANIPEATGSLTNGFVSARSPLAAKAVTEFGEKQYAAGATDLAAAMTAAARSFDGRTGRQQVIVYMGDGESTLAPLADADRAKLAADLLARDVAAFTVPVGTRLDSKNLHGLATATGGAVVRILPADKAAEVADRLKVALDAPVLRPDAVQFGPAVGEFLPAKLPPLRGDAPTLVIGTLKPGQEITCRIDGSVNGQPQQVTLSHQLPAADASNYFLASMLGQWRKADPTAPAYVRADRGLALAFEQTRLAHDECLNQAYWALTLDNHTAAEKLFKAARAIDPRDEQAINGLKVVEKLKSGVVTPKQVQGDGAAGVKFARVDTAEGTSVVRERVAMLAQDTPAADPAPAPASTPAASANLLDLERGRRRIVEQQITQSVEESIRRARETVRVDPDSAYDLLERQRLTVGDNTDLSEITRSGLLARLVGAQRTVRAEGTLVKQQQESDLRRRITEDSRRDAERARLADEEKVRERVRAFTALMNQARYNEAYQESLQLQREQIAAGRPVPVQAVAAYNMGLNAANLREYENLRRTKEERFMLTMLRVDESHVPFPDEPPVAFPAVTFWKEITRRRQEKYEFTSAGGDMSPRTRELRRKLYEPVTLDANEVPLKDLLTNLSATTGITFVLNAEAFKTGMKIMGASAEEQVVKYPKLNDVAVATVLELALKPIDGTFIVRRDYVELTTKLDAIGIDNKAVRAYAVADLVTPFPDAVNSQALQQNLQVLGSSLSANGQAIFGAAGGGLNIGNFGGISIAGGIGGLGIGGLGGGLAVGGGGGGSLLGGIVGNPNAPNGGIGFGGGTGQTNLGAGGGVLGFGGGQLGQFGNLGGQFGLQGGNTSQILIQLIEDTVARKEWDRTAGKYLQNAAQTRDEEEGAPIIDVDKLNSLGYYPTSRALVVRGSARINPGGSGARINTPGQGGAMIPRDRGGDVIVFGPNANKDAPAVAKAPAAPKPADAVAVAKSKVPHDPKLVWNAALAKDDQSNKPVRPRQVIAIADMLATCEKFEDVAELLKADLRHGILLGDCVFEALAVALQGSQADPVEVQRARLSAIDLQPTEAASYLSAAAAMDEMGLADKAVKLCQMAAKLEPNAADPYSKALAYAPKAAAVDTDAVQWAAGNLLRRDWAGDNAATHAQARGKVDELATKLAASGRQAEAARLRDSLTQERRRDLVVEAMWGDEAEVAFSVTEPTGTTCTEHQRQTPNGGAWSGNRFTTVAKRGYVAAEAFPGSYTVKLSKVWGTPLGNKVTVRVTKLQGTADEVQELHTVPLDSAGHGDLTLTLEGGRRTALASVPVSANQAARTVARVETQEPGRVFGKLRAMTEGVATADTSRKSGRGGAGDAQPTDTLAPEAAAGASHVNRVGADFSVGMALTAQATVAADRKSMRVSLAPVFQTASETPDVNLSPIPGGR